MTPVVATSMQRGQSENDAVEALLIRLWCSVLEREEIGRDDEFFRCGGHSLLAVRLLAAIQREFGCTLSMADLLQAPTPAQQAEALRRRLSEGEAKVPAVQAPSSLVTLRSEGRGEPLFLVHPVGGNVACYVDLARRLECDRPVYGLQALVSEFRGSRAAQPSLERLAANYVNALRERQKHGPYHLGGWSLGGVIAFEMAQQLRAAGEEVALLVLIDSYTPKLLERLESEHSSADGDQEGGLRRAFGRDFLGTAGPRALHGHEHELFEVFRTNVQAMQAYAPKPYQGPVTLLSAAEGGPADAAHGWAPLVPAGLALHTLPGDHYSILKPPQLDNLVQALERALRGLASLSTVNDPNPETHINK
jgi:thioesterase domain-containing protein/acyl carrier protein